LFSKLQSSLSIRPNIYGKLSLSHFFIEEGEASKGTKRRKASYYAENKPARQSQGERTKKVH